MALGIREKCIWVLLLIEPFFLGCSVRWSQITTVNKRVEPSLFSDLTFGFLTTVCTVHDARLNLSEQKLNLIYSLQTLVTVNTLADIPFYIKMSCGFLTN